MDASKLTLLTGALLLDEYDAPLQDVAWVAESSSFVLFLFAMLNDAVGCVQCVMCCCKK
jgi:hypothetical protein